jgi:hypothetical protein
MKYVTLLELFIGLTLFVSLLTASSCITQNLNKVCRNYPHLNLKEQPINFPLIISLQNEFTPEELVSIKSAINIWNETSGLELFVISEVNKNDDKDSCGFIFLKRMLFDSKENKLGKTLWDACNATIKIVPMSDLELLKSVLTHELGHSINLNHDIYNEESVMYPKTYVGQIILPRHIKHIYDATHCWD